MPNKIFSKKKWVAWAKKEGYSKEMIELYCRSWVDSCDGLTEEEMSKRGMLVTDEWLIEKKGEDKNGTNI